MSYKIGQYTNNTIAPETRGEDLLDSTNPGQTNLIRSIYFESTALRGQKQDTQNIYLNSFRQLGIAQNSNNEFFDVNTYYFLNFNIKRVPKDNYIVPDRNYSQEECNSMTFTIFLTTKTGSRTSPITSNDYTQKIGSLKLPYSKSSDAEYIQCNLIFNPNRSDYKYIAFKTERTPVDFDFQARSNQQENTREWLLLKTSSDVELGQIQFMKNIETDSFKYYSLNNISNQPFQFQKIGYQGRPGSFIVINGVVIRIGKSGVFQLDHNQIDITSIMIPPTDNFLLDYAYQESGVS